MKRRIFRRGDKALFTGDGLTECPCKVVEACGVVVPTEYLVKLDGDIFPRRCEAYQLQERYNDARK